MSTVVKQDKKANHKQARGNSQEENDPIRIPGLDGTDHDVPQKKVGDESVRDLPEGFSRLGFLEPCDSLIPVRSYLRRFDSLFD